jgi:hypothetical protein
LDRLVNASRAGDGKDPGVRPIGECENKDFSPGGFPCMKMAWNTPSRVLKAVWRKKTMSRMEESNEHITGRFSLTGWSGTDSLNGLLLRPMSLRVFTADFE